MFGRESLANPNKITKLKPTCTCSTIITLQFDCTTISKLKHLSILLNIFPAKHFCSAVCQCLVPNCTIVFILTIGKLSLTVLIVHKYAEVYNIL